MTLQTGQILQNRYRIVALIGQGGFGAVYRAWDINLNMVRAVKENLDTSPEAQQQFQRESQILAGLRHPNLPAVTDYFFIPGSGQYLVMDFVEGQDLEQMRQRQGALDVGQVLNWVGQVCQALAYLHSQNPAIIHRDIKPANIKITPQGKAVLVDFGISKIYDPHLKTTVGARAITPGYSPIEQYGQGQTDARSDIYALGATLYTLLTGQEPAEATALLSGTANLTPPRQLNPAIPNHLVAAIEQAMNSKPTNRYQTVANFQQALNPLPTAPVAPPQVLNPFPTTPVAPPPMAKPTLLVPGPPKKRSSYRLISFGLGAVGLCCLLMVMMVWPGSQPETQAPQSTSTIIPVAELPTHTSAVGETPPPTDSTLATISPSSLTATPPLPSLSTISAIPTDIPPQTPVGVVVQAFPLLSGGQVNMVFVPAGTFLMGSVGGNGDEQPQHTIYLDAYWIDQTEVTNAMYAQCVAAGICPMPTDPGAFNNPDYANHPVVFVDWERANIYCTWTGGSLPTEAQWEKAARGTDGRIYPWGNASPGCDLANYNDCIDRTMEVGSYPLWDSPYGALDMAGNVWEWVADWYDENYYATSPDANPTGPSSGGAKVLRGGAWYDFGVNLRAAYRNDYDPALRYDDVGFRCAQE